MTRYFNVCANGHVTTLCVQIALVVAVPDLLNQQTRVYSQQDHSLARMSMLATQDLTELPGRPQLSSRPVKVLKILTQRCVQSSLNCAEALTKTTIGLVRVERDDLPSLRYTWTVLACCDHLNYHCSSCASCAQAFRMESA